MVAVAEACSAPHIPEGQAPKAGAESNWVTERSLATSHLSSAFHSLSYSGHSESQGLSPGMVDPGCGRS